MLQGMIDDVWKKLPGMWRDGLDSVLEIWLFVVLAMLSLMEKNSVFHLLKWYSYEAQHFSKDLQRLLFSNRYYVELPPTKLF